MTTPEGIGNKAGKAASFERYLKYITIISYTLKFLSPVERGVEPVDSLSIERGMKQEERSEFVFVLNSLMEASPSSDLEKPDQIGRGSSP